MSTMYCPLCFNSDITLYRKIGSTQWYVCGNGHKFSNPIILDALSPEQAAAAVDAITKEKHVE